MTMNTTRPHPLSDADWERLSAYMDDALSPAERRAVEERLARDPAWQAAWAELQALNRALRDLPPPRRPRSFVLTPEMVRPRARRRWLPRLNWAWGLAASAAAVLLLFVMVGGWALLGGGMANKAAQAPQAVAVEAEARAAPRLEMAAPEAASGEGEVAESPAEARPQAEALELDAAKAADMAATPTATAAGPTSTPGAVEPAATAAQPGRSRSPFPQINPLGLTVVCAFALAVGLGVGWWALRRRG